MLLVLLASACAYEPVDTELAGSDDDDQALVAMEPLVSTDAAREPLSGAMLETTGPQRWSFAVLSDLHLPNPRSAVVDREVAALVGMGVRFVVITGDDTNGSASVDHRQRRVNAWW